MPQERPEYRELIRVLRSVGDGAPSPDQKLELMQRHRSTPEDSRLLDQSLIGHMVGLEQGLLEAREHQGELRTMIDSLLAPPWFPGILVRMVMTHAGPRALAMYGGTHRLVALSEEVDEGSLKPGDEVYLGRELNVVLGKSPDGMPRCGETALLERKTEDGRLVLRTRDDQEVIVNAAGELLNDGLRSGDQLRWDRSVWLAFEKVGRSKGTHLFLEETPAECFEDIGGLDRQIERIKQCIDLPLKHADTAREYHLKPSRGILLYGPPGTGKTMVARALANYSAQLSRSKRSRFMHFKPSELHSMWYSQSEANYREAFRVAREAGAAEPEIPVIMFFDEVDSIASSRGSWGMRVDDRVMTAFTAELDGLESRGNILVVAATNRLKALDPAIIRQGRLGDEAIEIPRPNMKAARTIFDKYLKADMPYADDGIGGGGAEGRERILDSVISRLYAPNGYSELATLVFRDGKRRPLKIADVISGACIAQIVKSASSRACAREIKTGEKGLRLTDVLSAAEEQCAAAVRVLSPANCREHLSGLPDDVDVVSVLPAETKVTHLHSYLNLRAA